MSASYLPNTSFVLKAVEDVVYEDRPVPERKFLSLPMEIYSNLLSSPRQRGASRGQEDWYVCPTASVLLTEPVFQAFVDQT
jgi:hypothetical protein